MSFEDLVGGVNKSCLGSFGREFTFTPASSSEPITITGILEAGAEQEETAPGDGSTYARLWINAADISPAPQRGDEISSATTVYKIVRMQEDAAGGLWILLRQDRPVS
jgi:hypothetical protein